MNELPNEYQNAETQNDVSLSAQLLGPVICSVDYIPIDCMVVADRDHPDYTHLKLTRPWNICITSILQAIDFDPLDDLFNLQESDAELNDALTDALIFFLKNLGSPKADACSLMIGSIKRFLKSHRHFRRYVKDVNDD